MELEPITRQEQIIAGKDLKPITRMEMFLKEYGGASLVSPSGKKFKLTVDDNGVLGTTVVKEETAAEGDGAEFYTLAPTALSFRSTAPLSEFSEVQVNGETVDPENYTLEEGSTIVTFSIDYLKKFNVGNYEVAIVSDGETAKGGFTVAAPELNEHGFYYNQPYTAYVQDYGNCVLFYRENGVLDFIITDNDYIETATYTVSGNAITNNVSLGAIPATISGGEIQCAALGTTLKLDNTSVAADADYMYVYKEDLGGYEVKCIDKTKAEYGAIKTGINGKPTVKLGDHMFCEPNAEFGSPVVIAPEIPDSVTIIGDNCFYKCESLTSITIPNSVTSIGNEAFMHCRSLTSVIIPDSVTSIGYRVFYGCSELTSVTIGNGLTRISSQAFQYTSLENIKFNGTIEQWNAVSKGEGWNNNTPATYVQCSDGKVSLV